MILILFAFVQIDDYSVAPPNAAKAVQDPRFVDAMDVRRNPLVNPMQFDDTYLICFLQIDDYSVAPPNAAEQHSDDAMKLDKAHSESIFLLCSTII